MTEKIQLLGASLEFDFDDLLDKPAKATAIVVADGVRAAGWVNTGRLAAGIHVEGASIMPPADRLVRDGELAGKLRAALPDPFDDPRVSGAIDEALDDAVTVKRKRR